MHGDLGYGRDDFLFLKAMQGEEALVIPNGGASLMTMLDFDKAGKETVILGKQWGQIQKMYRSSKRMFIKVKRAKRVEEEESVRHRR